ncbi:MAG: class I SAM-dependent methyltransferase [Usitatibacter sp.]
MSSAAHCLACGSSSLTEWATAHDVEYCTTQENFRYNACTQCNALSIDPVPSERLAVIYPASYYSYQPPGASIISRVKTWLDSRLFRSVLAQVPGEALRVLDVGGGAGHEAANVRAIDKRVRYTQVVDLDPAAAELARANGHEYFLGAIEDFESRDPVDLLLLLNLIEHVADPQRVLSRIGRMLSPGGAILVKTPNHDALDARIFRRHSWAGLHCPRHFVLFTRPAFEAMAARSGLRVRHFAYTQGAPFWAASVVCWLAEKGLARVSAERPVVYHPLFGVLSAAFAAVDFARMPFAKTSQMILVLERNTR